MFVPEQYVGSGTGCIWQSRALQKSIRMNEIDYLVPAPPRGYEEGSLQSLAYTVAVASDVQLPPIPSSACRSWPPRPAEIRRHVRAWCAEQRAVMCMMSWSGRHLFYSTTCNTAQGNVCTIVTVWVGRVMSVQADW